MTQPVDVLIIGSGASGAAVAWSLAETKMHILCLEQGDWMKPSEYPSAGRDWEARQLSDFHYSPNRRARDTDYPINDANSPIKIANFNGVGGGTVLYAGPLPALPSVGLPRAHAGWRRRRLADRLRDAGAVLRRERPHDGRIRPGRRSRLSAARTDDAAAAAGQVPARRWRAGSTSSAGTGGRPTARSPPRTTRAARSASTSRTAPRAARRAPRRAPTSPTGPPRSAPASNCARAAGCARSPGTSTAWRPAWSITTPTASSTSSRPKSSSWPATPSARRASC